MSMTIKTINLKRYLWWLSWGLIIIGSVLCFVVPYVDNIRSEKIIKELTDRYGLVVRYGDPSEFHIPPLPAAVCNNNKLERVDKRYLLTALEGIRSGLAKYPPALIRKYLSAVFISGSIKMYGVEVAGTHFNSWIYVSATSGNSQLGSQYYAETLHHELSALFFYGLYSNPSNHDPNIVVFKTSTFPFIKWHFVNALGFKYLERDIDVIHAAGKPRDLKEASSWYKAGFVSAYGMTDLENDVSTFAELAMEHPAKLKELADHYPRIASKTGLFVEFYSSLAPEMAEYFKSVGLQNMPITYRKIPSIAYYKDANGHVIRLDK